ncbi:hypothetical protein BD410DRAFT_449935 [Rickenella mellea]|uniref:Uncharacterized protein n=1 Tax=Rickenella mellea TaxID=50990 RepID=A0A4Y7PX27_9AGAM|nr:hypothetical protein BD410DRAFT_449935 [Rickenella mellea]
MIYYLRCSFALPVMITALLRRFSPVTVHEHPPVVDTSFESTEVYSNDIVQFGLFRDYLHYIPIPRDLAPTCTNFYVAVDPTRAPEPSLAPTTRIPPFHSPRTQSTNAESGGSDCDIIYNFEWRPKRFWSPNNYTNDKSALIDLEVPSHSRYQKRFGGLGRPRAGYLGLVGRYVGMCSVETVIARKYWRDVSPVGRKQSVTNE